MLNGRGVGHALRRLAYFVRELWHFGWGFRSARFSLKPRIATKTGAKVLVIPGLMADDRSMLPLRLALRAYGYRAYGWRMGTNNGVTVDLLDRVDARVRSLQRGSVEPVIVLGWSLGGLIAREYAKRAPDRVASVITLASPFSGDISAAWIARVYKWVAGHSVSSIPIACTLHEKPPVPTAAIWSSCDGAIPATSARGQSGEADFEFEIACAHMTCPRAQVAHNAVVQAIERCSAMHDAKRASGTNW